MSKIKSRYTELHDSLKSDNSDINRKNWSSHLIEQKIKLSGLVELIYEDHPVGMRFSWLLGELSEKKPELVLPVVPALFSDRKKIKIKNFDRSLAKFFWLCGIPAKIESEAVEQLFLWLTDPKISVSTKNFCISALQRVTQKHPDLKNELKLVIEDQMEKNSVSFKKRAESVLNTL